ncbi:MAG: glycosyltransferase [Chitinophagaceae bacterium]|nr:glycosyltransferase [Chitinophagaceae bacterium]
MAIKKKNEVLVSCVMPTYNRRAFVPHAIRYFLRQDYPFKELIIIDDGTDSIADLVPDDPSIRYYALQGKITLGAKLNLACEHAMGSVIVNWDDDDWYAPNRLTYQVQALEGTGMNVCGINKLLYFDVVRKQAFQYVYPSDQRVWLLGSSLCYKKELWQRQRFVENDVGMDGLFVWATPPREVKVLEDHTFSVHMIHASNVSPKRTDSGWWHPYPVEDISRIVSSDWHVYANGALLKGPSVKGAVSVRPPVAPVKNVFACLVHENEDCVVDLVRNLHYHEPGATIILYNGGGNSGLLKDRWLFEKFGAVVYPSPRPVKHGYLHDFAFSCMQYAVDSLSFDTFTIVDSDQLLIRGGYSSYLAEYLHNRPGVGMLSSAPARVYPNDRHNYVALQAFKEIDLWKPLLQAFPEGEEKFVHWTFWPSTVFTAKAVKDICKMVRENECLKKILQETKIWATEEVILPTLVRLLGYEIALNPCSYDFVKYRAVFSVRDMQTALSRADAYWVHPVERKYENPLRKHIRQESGNYRRPMPDAGVEMYGTGVLSAYKRTQKINGWLEEKEADLLMTMVLKACIQMPDQHTIVEVGSYEGKSTVLLGSMVKTFFPDVRIVSIDPHDGRLGSLDQGLVSVAPSLTRFTSNLQAAGLSEVVEVIQGRTCDITWSKPLFFLIIDGLHDYPSVARDFRQMAPSLVKGGYIAFHDYADYFPGVQAFVHELLESGAYCKVGKVDTMIILIKVNI